MTKEIFLQNKYSKCYFRIIENARDREINDVYLERHHIVPKSLGGLNIPENLVSLTAKEHFICHLLLVKAVLLEHRKKMNYAFWRMCNVSSDRYKPSSRFYELGRRIFIESQINHPPYNLNQSEESRTKISKGMKKTLSTFSDKEMEERMLNSCCRPDVYTKERGDKISKTRTGYKDTPEAKKNKSLAAKKRNNNHLLVIASENKGKTWRLINGKRVWMEKIS